MCYRLILIFYNQIGMNNSSAEVKYQQTSFSMPFPQWRKPCDFASSKQNYAWCLRSLHFPYIVHSWVKHIASIFTMIAMQPL